MKRLTCLLAGVASFALWAGVSVAEPGSQSSPQMAVADPAQTGAIPHEPAEASAGRAFNVDKAAFKGVVDLYKRGDIAEADAAAKGIHDPVARSVLEWIAIRTNGKAIGFDRIAAFARTHRDWPGDALTRRRAEEALFDSRKPNEIVTAFFKDEKPVSGAGKYVLALALQAGGKDEEAARLIRSAWREEPMSESVEEEILTRFKGVLGKADHRARMEMLLFKNQWDAATRAAGRAGTDYLALAKARIAVVRKASNALKLIAAVPSALHKDSSYAFTRALYLRHKKHYAEAAKAMAGISRDPAMLVDGDAWWTERRVLARELLDEDKPQLAYEVARDHGAETGPDRIEAEFHAGWIALRFLNNSKLAARHFALAAKDAVTPISLARVAYWQGRAAEAEKNLAEARRHYEAAAKQTITYYGQIARVKLGLRDLPLRRPPQGRLALIAGSEPVQAIRLLYTLDEGDLVTSFYVALAQRFNDAAHLDALADLAQSHRDAKAMVLIGKAATQKGLPLDMAAFPTNGIPTFEAGGEPVEKPLVYAIARQESIFDAKVVSSAGARGLMQLMPATAKITAKRAGMDFAPAKLTTDAAYNAKLGAAHLRDLVDAWKGSYILTIASYNAGPGNVRKWLAAYGDPRAPGVDPVDWVERIPFSETRNYVQRVLENLQVYRHRLGERTATLIDTDLQRGIKADLQQSDASP
jgi:soluble lytic murein transglycosylase